jgi:N-acetylglucosaminyl-diphospho-decaprenol L-rhamnosyltransferase
MHQTASDPALSIVIVNYNGGMLLRSCLESLARHPSRAPAEIVVIDNASTDGSREWLEEHRADVKLIKCSANVGLTRGFNRGIAAARAPVILSLDSDTEVTSGALDAMLDHLAVDAGAGACGCTLVYPDGTPQRTARRFPSPWAGLFGRRSTLTRLWPNNPFSRRYLMAEHHEASRPFDVDTLSTACIALRRKVIDQVGGHDESYFVYWSDTDWCHRIKKGGWRIVSLPGATVVHNENLKSGHRKSRRTKMVIDFHRGAYRYYAKHHAGPLNPMRYIAMSALTARATLVLAQDELRRLTAPNPTAPG